MKKALCWQCRPYLNCSTSQISSTLSGDEKKFIRITPNLQKTVLESKQLLTKVLDPWEGKKVLLPMQYAYFLKPKIYCRWAFAQATQSSSSK